MEKIILFGAGSRCRDAVKNLKKEYTISYIVDNDVQKIGKNIEGIEIVGIDFLKKAEDKKIIITPYLYHDILEQLVKLEITNIYLYEEEILIKKVWKSNILEKYLKSHEFCLGKFLELVIEKEQLVLDNVCFKSGGSSVLDYAFLKSIMQYFELQTYLEIGTYIGESINNVSTIAKKCYSITVPPSHPASMKFFCEKYEIVDFSNRLINRSNIIQYLVDSKEFDFQTIKENIDIYFIDGDHSMEGIENDTRKVFNHKGKNSFVIWHDVKKEGHQVNEIAIEAIYGVIGEENFKNLYICDMNWCGIYVPEQYCKLFDSLCNFNREDLYTYNLSIGVGKIDSKT